MSPQEFQDQLSRCRTRFEVERLLGVWFSVRGTAEELQQCRDAAIARLEQIIEDGTAIGARGGAFIAEVAA